VQPSLFDESRALAGHHTLWTYCHVPNGSELDMTETIEAQIERSAPGFRKIILARKVAPPRELTRRNANLIGGDINGGAPILKQLFLRPTPSMYKTPAAGLYICSSSTPPGGGVHGMCGYFAARKALKECFKQERQRPTNSPVRPRHNQPEQYEHQHAADRGDQSQPETARDDPTDKVNFQTNSDRQRNDT
jgi:phytoene dehydrogenase-like protein